MKKPLSIALSILVLIIAGITYLLLSDPNQAKDTTINNGTISQMESLAPLAPQGNNMIASGAYIDYREGVIASTSGTKLLFFHAPWCPQCRDLEASINKDGVPSGVTIIKVDYDTSRELRQKYGVTLQTTVVRIDDSSTLIKKFVAYDDPSISAVKNNLL